MKDKEFDQLFKDRLGDAEVEPSVSLWNNIAEELKPRKRRVFSGYWIAAAVAIIIVSVVWISPKEEKIRLQGKVLLASEHTLPSAETNSDIHRYSKTGGKSNVDNYESTPLIIAPRANEANYKEAPTAKKNAVRASIPVTGQLDATKAEDKSGNLSGHVYTDVVIAKVEAPDEIDADLMAENDASTKGIRNVGDFVNYVVSKVDKREDKFLKFNTDDDENSSLVGINIGFIKLNLKRHK